jgi:hypothetical protein
MRSYSSTFISDPGCDETIVPFSLMKKDFFLQERGIVVTNMGIHPVIAA